MTAGTVPVKLSVQHLAGGAAAALPVTIRATVRPWLDHWEHREPPRPYTASTTLDSKGTAHLDIPMPGLERKGLLTVEMDYQDANGQLKTARKQIECWPAAIELVVETDDTQSSSRRILVKARGLDGAPAPGVPVEASIYHPRTSGYRRLPGGFRAHLQRSESPLLTTCSGKTDATGSLGCSVPPETPNSVFVEATMQSLNPAFRLGPAFEEVIVTGSYVRAPGFRAERVDEDPAPRERFDALLFWRARLATNDEGTAEAEIPLNDLLTSFRIVAVATAGDDLFGTGQATIRTTQDLILYAGLPEVVGRATGSTRCSPCATPRRRPEVSTSRPGPRGYPSCGQNG